MASPFSGKAGRNAAIWTAGYLQNLQSQIEGTLKAGKEAGKPYLEQALGETKTGFADAVRAMQDLYGQGADVYREAIGAYDPLIGRGLTGYDMYLNALGLGGAEGTTAAQNAFTVSPGFEFQVNTATDAAQRAANKIGQLYSGNTATAVQDRANALASQEYGNWLTRLGQFPGYTTQAVTGQSQALQGLGNLYGTEGTATGTLMGQGVTAGTDILTNLANLEVGTAGQIANLQSGIGSQIAQVGMQGMLAGQQAAANRWSAGLGLASGLMGMLGKMGGMGF